MSDNPCILSGETRRGWQVIIPHRYLSGFHHLCRDGWSKEIENGDDVIRKKHESSILMVEEYGDTGTVKIRRFSTISPKINADLMVIQYADVANFIHSIHLTPTISGAIFQLYSHLQRLKMVVFNAFSLQGKFAVWKITAPGAAYEYEYGGSMFLDEHSRRLVIIFRMFTVGTSARSVLKGFAMVAYELSLDYNNILNDGLGTIIYAKDIKVAHSMSLDYNEAIMVVVPDGANSPELEDVITIDRMGVKSRQSFQNWLEISESERPDFMHVMESYRKFQIGEPPRGSGSFFNSCRPFEWYFQYNMVMSRCIAGAWYATADDGIVCKRTKVDTLKNLAAKALVDMYPSEIDVAQLRAGMKTVVGFDVFEAVTEEGPLNVEVDSSFI